MADLFDLLADYGRPVKIHNEGDGWDVALLEIARAHPRLPIVVAHAGLGTPSEAATARTSSFIPPVKDVRRPAGAPIPLPVEEVSVEVWREER